MAVTEPVSGELLSARELRAWRGLLTMHAALVKSLDAELEAHHGIPLTSYEVLRFLADAEDERMRMCDLASSVLLSRSGLTRLVDRLAREGLLERVACADDARGAYARLTPAGREKVAEAGSTHRAGVRALFLRHFGAEEQELLAEFFERVLPDAVGRCGCGPKT
jgi:DNA-binding MarR family transcriptional regulator